MDSRLTIQSPSGNVTGFSVTITPTGNLKNHVPERHENLSIREVEERVARWLVANAAGE